MKAASMATRDEVLAVLAGRYEGANRRDRGRILDELVALTGHHRKHAARVLRGRMPTARNGLRPSRRLYGDAARQALIIAARNQNVADAQSWVTFDAHSVRLEVTVDARSVRLGA